MPYVMASEFFRLSFGKDSGGTVFQRPEDHDGVDAIKARESRTAVVVAGPGSSLTIPGIIVSQIVQSLAQMVPVTRIEVDLGTDYMSGLHRAPSLAAAHDAPRNSRIVRLRAPNNVRFRAQAFREWIGTETRTVIAYAWPGIDNGWIKQFLQVARMSGASTIVVCQSRPNSSRTKLLSLVDIVYQADVVIVGDANDAQELAASFGPSGPIVKTHRALSLGGRNSKKAVNQITAFLPKDNVSMLSTLLSAFDGIPEAWIANLSLQVVMRYSSPVVPDMVERSYHAEYVKLVGEDISSIDLEQLCATSSALIVADPALDSRAFLTAVNSWCRDRGARDGDATQGRSRLRRWSARRSRSTGVDQRCAQSRTTPRGPSIPWTGCVVGIGTATEHVVEPGSTNLGELRTGNQNCLSVKRCGIFRSHH
jgi:hypothetical protein